MLNIDELNTLNSYANERDKQVCDNFIEMWRDEGIASGYFGAKCNEIIRKRRVTYNDILELYIYYCFVMYETDVNDYEQKEFRDLANFYYQEGQKEVGTQPKEITDSIYYHLMQTPSANGYTLYEYKWGRALSNTYQIHRLAVQQIQQGQKPSVKDMDREIEKEQTERLSIRNVIGKGLVISGVIDMIMIGVNNMAKVEGIKLATKRARRYQSKIYCGIR